MAIFPTIPIDQQNIKVRYGEKYLSDAVNKKFLAIPRGVYTGFTPSFTGETLILSPDTTHGVSLARLTSQDDNLYSLDVVLTDTIQLDFSDHDVFPTNVVIKANGALGLQHSASLVTQIAGASDPTEILVCVITGAILIGSATGTFVFGETVTATPSGATGLVAQVEPGVLFVNFIVGTFQAGDSILGNSSSATAVITSAQRKGALFDSPLHRDSPYAYATAPLGYGFMADGSVEALLQAVDVSAEIEAARTGVDGTVYPTLGDRLAADMAGDSIGRILGKEVFTFKGVDYTLGAPTSTINVSSSFCGAIRLAAGLQPAQDVGGFGSETRAGAITSGTLPAGIGAGAFSDATRNVCEIINATTKERITDSSGAVVYGRLSLNQVALTGNVTFDGTVNVTGLGTLFTVETQAGDIIQDPSGNFWVVETTPIIDTALTLVPGSAPIAGAVASPTRRRFELAAVTRSGLSTEAAHSLAAGDVSFFCPVWRGLDESVVDYYSTIYQGGEPVAVGIATTTESGLAQIHANAPSGKAGAVYQIRRQGGQVGQDHIHTVDFAGATFAGPGVVDVTQAGPAGPAGPTGSGGVPGPTGPRGPTGVGFTDYRQYEFESSPHVHLSLGFGFVYSFSVDFSIGSNIDNEILAITGSVMEWYVSSGVTVDSNDHFDITDIRRENNGSGVPVVGVIEATVPSFASPLGFFPEAEIRLMLSAAGR